MKTKLTLRFTLSCLCLLFVQLLTPQNAVANKAVSSELKYIHISDSTYLINYTYSYHARNQAHLDTVELMYRAPGCHSGDTIKIPLGSTSPFGYPFCGRKINEPDSLYTLQFSIPLTLPAKCSEWIFSVSHLERDAENIISGQPLYTEARLNNLLAANNTTPTYSKSQNLFIEATVPNTYSFSPFDSDGDSLAIILQQAQADHQTQIPYLAGYSLQSPFPVIGSISYDPVSYSISFTADTTAVGHYYTLQTSTEEYRQINGTYQKIGSSTRNYFVYVDSFTPVINEGIIYYLNDTLVNPNNILTLEACHVNRIALKISPIDSANPARFCMLQSTFGNAVIQYHNALNDSVTIDWIPNSPPDLNRTYYFIVCIQTFGCPLPGTTTLTLAYRFKNQNLAEIIADTSTIQQGQSKQLQVRSLVPDTLSNGQPIKKNYRWVPSIGLNNDTISNPVATPAQTTLYTAYIYNADTTGCVDSASFLVKVDNTLSVKEEVSVYHSNRQDYLLNASHPYLQFEKEWENSSLKIYDSSGKLVSASEKYDNSWTGKEVKAGIYFYTLFHPRHGVRTGKIMLQK